MFNGFLNMTSRIPLAINAGLQTIDFKHRRKQAQKIEFMLCWVLIFALGYPRLSHRTRGALKLALIYYRTSILTRALAYWADFKNAKQAKGRVPYWLFLHHAGALFMHATAVLFGTRISIGKNLIVFFIASQASHNTWTRELNLTLYWVNVALGVVACSYLLGSLYKESLSAASHLIGLAMTVAGVALLLFKTKRAPKNEASLP